MQLIDGAPPGKADHQPGESPAGSAVLHSVRCPGAGAAGSYHWTRRRYSAPSRGSGADVRQYSAVRYGGIAGQRHEPGDDSAAVPKKYTHILIDCQPSLGMLTVNALATSNWIAILVQVEPAKGLE